MKVTTEILSSYLLNKETQPKSQKVEDKSEAKAQISEKDILSITRENQVAANVSLKSFSEALYASEELKENLLSDPYSAMVAQGNISPSIAASLI